MALNLSKGDQFGASNKKISTKTTWGEPKEDEMVHQLVEDKKV